MAKKEKAKPVTSKMKAPVPESVVPYDEENKHLSKADFVKKMKIRNEKLRKLDAYKKQLEREETDKRISKEDKLKKEEAKEVKTVSRPADSGKKK